MKRFLCLTLFLACFLSVLSVSAAQNMVSLHKRYELLTKASEGYPDDDYDLTNGRYGTPIANGDKSYYYRNTEYVGFHRDNADENGNFVILLDLAEVYTELSDFEAGYLIETEFGISAPEKIAFSISDTKNGEYTQIGEIALSASEQTQKAGIATVTADEPVSGRYVKVMITPREGGNWTFIDEIHVLQGRNPLTSGSSDTESGSDGTSGSENTQTPATGDRGVLTLAAFCTASALGTAALLGKRR